MRKKSKKTAEQKLAEDFFPVDKEDLKFAIEKPASHTEIVGLMENKKTKKPRNSKKKLEKKTPNKKRDFSPEKIKLKKGGYELIITEKPQAALKISQALGKGKEKKKTLGNVPYYELEKLGKKIVVACAVGHLFTLSQISKSSVPVFDIKWVPNFLARKGDFTKRYYDALLKLAKSAESITIATDYDIEGEVIGLNAVRFIAGQPDANRMKFSTLTEKELNKSYEDKAKKLNWGQAIAGETRHYLDWYYGINLSRAIMNAIKAAGSFKIMSVGRVQGPALKLIVEREKKIRAFKPQKYWHVFATIKDPKTGEFIELLHNKDIFEKSELKKFQELKGQEGEVTTKNSTEKIQPNSPFNLTNLQTESYKFFRLTPAKTLQIAQSLYLRGLISYPRTSSQKLPPSINCKGIIKKISGKYRATSLIKRGKPIEGRKSDPAHPSIYPTGEFIKLTGDEKKIYDLIAKRFLALFMEDAIKENRTLTAQINGHKFSKKGSYLSKEGWTKIYPSGIIEKKVPDINGTVKIEKTRSEEKETQPPKRYSPASIVSELEKRGLGTKATRASILETLYDRGYIKNTSIEATPVGISLIETLEKHSPIITNEKLTREFEHEMDSIQRSNKDFEKKEESILKKARDSIKEISKKFISEEKEIGNELIQANNEFRKQQQAENRLNVCPVCKKGNLVIKYSRKTRRYFAACDKYPECKNTYSLPPNSLIKPAFQGKADDKTLQVCEECGFPKLISIRRGKRPWIFCFNPECPTNKERIEAYRAKHTLGNKNS